MPRRGENIRKRNDGRWEKRYIDSYNGDGKPRYKSVYGGSYAEVKAKYSSLQSGNAKSEVKSVVTFENLCILWLDDIKITVKESTYAHYHNTVHNHIIPYFQNTKAKQINNEIINNFIKEKIANGRLDGKGGLSPKSINGIVIILKEVIQYGADNKHIPEMPTAFKKPKVAVQLINVLSVQEQNKLEGYIVSRLDLIGIGILICLFTGIRAGELCALLWNDINFGTGMLEITKTLQRIKNTDEDAKTKTKIIIDTPKSDKSVRAIPMPLFLFSILKQFEEQYDTDDYVLTGKSRYAEPRTFERNFKIVLDKAGIDTINCHALRHTFATRAVERGFDTKSLSEILGHSSVRITLEKYVNSSAELKKLHMEKLSLQS